MSAGKSDLEVATIMKTMSVKYSALKNRGLAGSAGLLLLVLGFFPMAAAAATINDPLGDHTASAANPTVDIALVESFVDANNVTIRVSFSADTDMSAVVGVIDLDTDQNRSTGLLPMVSKQNIGADYYLDLFPLAFGAAVNVFDSQSNLAGTVQASISGQSV